MEGLSRFTEKKSDEIKVWENVILSLVFLSPCSLVMFLQRWTNERETRRRRTDDDDETGVIILNRITCRIVTLSSCSCAARRNSCRRRNAARQRRHCDIRAGCSIWRRGACEYWLLMKDWNEWADGQTLCLFTYFCIQRLIHFYLNPRASCQENLDNEWKKWWRKYVMEMK